MGYYNETLSLKRNSNSVKMLGNQQRKKKKQPNSTYCQANSRCRTVRNRYELAKIISIIFPFRQVQQGLESYAILLRLSLETDKIIV